MHDLLQQQFQRLSALERDVMYWLAIEREAASLDTIQSDIARSVPPGTQETLLDAFDSLRRRSMIEARDSGLFTLQPSSWNMSPEHWLSACPRRSQRKRWNYAVRTR